MILSADQHPEIVVPVNEHVYEVMLDLGFDREEFMHDREHIVINWLQQFLVDARLDTTYHRNVFSAPIGDNGQVKKPSDYVNLIKAFVGTADGKTRITPFHVKNQESRRMVIDKGDYQIPKEYRRTTISEDQHCFHFGSQSFGYYFHMAYNAIMVNEQGFPYIDKRYQTAYEYFVLYKYHLMRGNHNAAKNFKSEYANERNRIRANVALQSITQDKIDQLTAKYHDPFFIGENPWLRERINHNTYQNSGNLPLMGYSGFYYTWPASLAYGI